MNCERDRYVRVALGRVSVRVHRRSAVVVLGALVVLVALCVLSLTLGGYGLSAADSFRRSPAAHGRSRVCWVCVGDRRCGLSDDFG